MKSRKEHSTNRINEKLIAQCDLAYAMCLLGSRWKIPILGKLEEGNMRFSELRDKIGGITDRMLTLQLKELEKDGLINRHVCPASATRITYELTELTRELIPVWRHLEQWAVKHRRRFEQQPCQCAGNL